MLALNSQIFSLERNKDMKKVLAIECHPLHMYRSLAFGIMFDKNWTNAKFTFLILFSSGTKVNNGLFFIELR